MQVFEHSLESEEVIVGGFENTFIVFYFTL